VKKKSGKWRVCIDFTNLSEACPKDNYPPSKIDQLIEATTEHELLSFMDAYSCYNQINMYPPDKDKTAFTTGRGIFCYKVMPFGLKNSGATFQQMINRVFKDLTGHTMEVYVDDMLMESIRH